MICITSIKGGWFKSIFGTLLRRSFFIIFESFFANCVLTKCPGLFAITLPLILVPTSAKSPKTSNNLCLAASLG